MWIMKKFAAALIGIVFLLGASYVDAKMVSIAGEKVNMRSGPGTSYGILWELGNGFPLIWVERKGDWIKVRDFEQDEGWVHRTMVATTPHTIVKTKRANIRSGPGAKHKLVGKAEYGVVFKTLAQKESWIQVKHEHGLSGWIERSLLWGW